MRINSCCEAGSADSAFFNENNMIDRDKLIAETQVKSKEMSRLNNEIRKAHNALRSDSDELAELFLQENNGIYRGTIPPNKGVDSVLIGRDGTHYLIKNTDTGLYTIFDRLTLLQFNQWVMQKD